MMKRLSVITLLALALAAPAAHAQSRELQALVREAQGQIGSAIGPGATFDAITLSANSLDQTFRFDRAAGANTSDGFLTQFTEIMAAGLCQQPPVNAFIAGGGHASVVIVDPGGAVLKTRSVTSC